MLILSNLFGDHALLQCEKAFPVRGKAGAFALLEGNFAGNTVRGRANDAGEFQLWFPPVAPGGPYTLTVRDLTTGETAVSNDLLAGELWLASGQSNMEFPVSSDAEASRLIAESGNEKIRFFMMPRRAQFGPQREAPGRWQSDVPESIGECSSVALSFARKLYHELKRPVGILCASRGGTIAESWSSREILLQNPAFSGRVLEREMRFSRPEYWENLQSDQLDVISSRRQMTDEEFEKTLPPGIFVNRGLEENWHLPDFDDTAWQPVSVPARWIDYQIEKNGTIWYRRTVPVPEHWLGRELVLSLGGIDKQDISYFNGSEIGRTGSRLDSCCWDVGRTYRVPGEINSRREAVIAVRNFSFMYDGGLQGPESLLFLAPADAPEEKIPLSGSWKIHWENQFTSLRSYVSGLGNPNEFAMMFNNMIQPLIPLAIRGVIWYQGCSNAPDGTYERLMSDLIRDWRFRWGEGDLPFIQVLLAGYHAAAPFSLTDKLPLLREAQLNAANATGNLTASAVDCGDEANIHPPVKREVGRRLALAALECAYHRIPCGTGPRLVRTQWLPGKAVLTFDHVGKGLCWRNGFPQGLFGRTGSGKITALVPEEITADQIFILSSAADALTEIFYSWADYPENAGLCNSEGLPAVPFRSKRTG